MPAFEMPAAFGCAREVTIFCRRPPRKCLQSGSPVHFGQRRIGIARVGTTRSVIGALPGASRDMVVSGKQPSDADKLLGIIARLREKGHKLLPKAFKNMPSER